MKIKVMTLLGTRPEIIRLSETMKTLDKYTNHVVVFTQQSFSRELGDAFFEELGLREPDYRLDVKANTVGEQVANILRQTEAALIKERPDAVLILGDTNSTLSCIVAKRLKIPVFHWEAGNRCFDDRVPEEVNRRIVDHTADVNMCYTEHARRNLLREGVDPQYVFVTGSPLVEVYRKSKDRATYSKVMGELGLYKGGYYLVSIHREENVDDWDRLATIFRALVALTGEKEVAVTVHPRTRASLKSIGVSTEGMILHEPFGLADYICLQNSALCCLSDSGTIHEDAAIWGIPVVSIRDSHERMEAYDAGNVVMSGVTVSGILGAVEMAVAQRSKRFNNPYDAGDCSSKIVRLIQSYCKLVKERKYGR